MTNSRILIQHTFSLLKEYEAIRLGVSSANTARDKRDAIPIAAEEEEILENYLKEQNVIRFFS